LPETRGPSFALPAEIVAALCRFRDLECNDQRWSHWCNWLDTQEMNQVLPEPMERANAIEYSDDITSVLKAEIQAQLERKDDWNEINFGGEGEPTLNLQALESLSKEFGSQIPIKVRTNGLIHCASSLKDWGVTSVSVALMTHDPSQYNEFMEPLMDTTTPGAAAAAHDQMCTFVESALACNLEVELTGVDRSEVDKQKAQELATTLGVEAEIRWRPYFP
jgi:organic radical activating enzyme